MKKSLKERVSDLSSLDSIIEENLKDPEFAAEYERASLRVAIARASKAAREGAGLTQEQLAEEMGVKKSQVGRLESMKDKRIPGIEFIANVATVTGRAIVVDHPRVHFKLTAKKSKYSSGKRPVKK